MWRLGIWGDRDGIAFGGFRQFGTVFEGFWKSLNSIVPKSVREATNHENNTTLRLHGYDLA
jgi:hypothetical protein